MKHALVTLAALALVSLAAVPVGAEIGETIKLTPRNASGVSGTATVSSPGDAAAAAVRVRVRNLEPRSFVRIQLNAVEGKRTGASVVVVLSGRADAQGRFAGSGRVRYRGAPVTFATIADGAHALSVVGGGKLLARGVVPGMD